MKPSHLILGGLGLAGLALALAGSSGPSRAPCGVTGPEATPDVKRAILDAWEARGYPRAEAEAAVRHESGFKPAALNCLDGRPVAGGLIQMIPVTLRSVGFDGDPGEFAGLSGAEQLPYVLQFLSRIPKWERPGDAMLALAAPAFVGADDDTIVYAVGSAAWHANPGLRASPDGPITAASIRAEII